MNDRPPITNREKHDAALREVKYRQKVYPRMVYEQRMTQAFADRQIAIMLAIANDYLERSEADAYEERLL
jgi:hypothetical protein